MEVSRHSRRSSTFSLERLRRPVSGRSPATRRLLTGTRLVVEPRPTMAGELVDSAPLPATRTSIEVLRQHGPDRQQRARGLAKFRRIRHEGRRRLGRGQTTTGQPQYTVSQRDNEIRHFSDLSNKESTNW